jgi:hypothetical protein
MTRRIWAKSELAYAKGCTYGISFTGTKIFFAYINEAAWPGVDTGTLEGG